MPWQPVDLRTEPHEPEFRGRAAAMADPLTDGIWAGTSKATRRAMRKGAA